MNDISVEALQNCKSIIDSLVIPDLDDLCSKVNGYGAIFQASGYVSSAKITFNNLCNDMTKFSYDIQATIDSIIEAELYKDYTNINIDFDNEKLLKELYERAKQIGIKEAIKEYEDKCVSKANETITLTGKELDEYVKACGLYGIPIIVEVSKDKDGKDFIKVSYKDMSELLKRNIDSEKIPDETIKLYKEDARYNSKGELVSFEEYAKEYNANLASTTLFLGEKVRPYTDLVSITNQAKGTYYEAKTMMDLANCETVKFNQDYQDYINKDCDYKTFSDIVNGTYSKGLIFDSLVGNRDLAKYNTQDYYNNMTESQRQTLLYIYEKEGKEATKEYLKVLEDSVNKSKAYTSVSNRINVLDGKGLADTLASFGFGTVDGIENCLEGLDSILYSNETRSQNQYEQMIYLSMLQNNDSVANVKKNFSSIKNPTEKDIENYNNSLRIAEMSENYKKVLSFSYQGGTSVGNMLPSVVANMVLPGSGLYILGASAGGNAKREAIQGGETNDAKIWADFFATALIEAGGEKLFGKILPETENLSFKSLLSEGGTEVFQGFAEGLKSDALYGKNDYNIEQAGSDFVGGVLMSLFFNGAAPIINKAGQTIQYTMSDYYNCLDTNGKLDYEKFSDNCLNKMNEVVNDGSSSETTTSTQDMLNGIKTDLQNQYQSGQIIYGEYNKAMNSFKTYANLQALSLLKNGKNTSNNSTILSANENGGTKEAIKVLDKVILDMQKLLIDNNVALENKNSDKLTIKNRTDEKTPIFNNIKYYGTNLLNTAQNSLALTRKTITSLFQNITLKQASSDTILEEIAINANRFNNSQKSNILGNLQVYTNNLKQKFQNGIKLIKDKITTTFNKNLLSDTVRNNPELRTLLENTSEKSVIYTGTETLTFDFFINIPIDGLYTIINDNIFLDLSTLSKEEQVQKLNRFNTVFCNTISSLSNPNYNQYDLSYRSGIVALNNRITDYFIKQNDYSKAFDCLLEQTIDIQNIYDAYKNNVEYDASKSYYENPKTLEKLINNGHTDMLSETSEKTLLSKTNDGEKTILELALEKNPLLLDELSNRNFENLKIPYLISKFKLQNLKSESTITIEQRNIIINKMINLNDILSSTIDLSILNNSEQVLSQSDIFKKLKNYDFKDKTISVEQVILYQYPKMVKDGKLKINQINASLNYFSEKYGVNIFLNEKFNSLYAYLKEYNGEVSQKTLDTFNRLNDFKKEFMLFQKSVLDGFTNGSIETNYDNKIIIEQAIKENFQYFSENVDNLIYCDINTNRHALEIILDILNEDSNFGNKNLLDINDKIRNIIRNKVVESKVFNTKTINDFILQNYSSNQGTFNNNESTLIRRIRYDADLRNYLNRFENLSMVEKVKLLEQVDAIGACSYSAIVNQLMYQLSKKVTPSEFKEAMGYSMYDIDGRPNYDIMLLDLYVTMNKVSLFNDEKTQVNKLQKQYFFKGEYMPEGLALSMFLSEFKNSPGLWINALIYSNAKYGHVAKGISIDEIINDFDIKEKLNNGNTFALTVYPMIVSDNLLGSNFHFNFYNEDGTVMITTDDWDIGHAVTLLDVLDNGDLLVSTWGKNAIIKADELKSIDFTIVELSFEKRSDATVKKVDIKEGSK